jgi:hypothetical protein
LLQTAKDYKALSLSLSLGQTKKKYEKNSFSFVKIIGGKR